MRIPPPLSDYLPAARRNFPARRTADRRPLGGLGDAVPLVFAVGASDSPPPPPKYRDDLPTHPPGEFGAVDFPYTILQPHYTRGVQEWTGMQVLNIGGPKYSNDPFDYIRSAMVDNDTDRINKWLHWFYETNGGHYKNGDHYYDSGQAMAVEQLNLADFKGILTDNGFLFFPVTENEGWKIYHDLYPYWSALRQRGTQYDLMHPVSSAERTPDQMSRAADALRGTFGNRTLGGLAPRYFWGGQLMTAPSSRGDPMSIYGTPGHTPYPSFQLRGVYNDGSFSAFQLILKAVSILFAAYGLASLATALISTTATVASSAGAAASGEAAGAAGSSAVAAATDVAASSVIDVLPEVVVTGVAPAAISAGTAAAIAAGSIASGAVLDEIVIQGAAPSVVSPALATSALAPVLMDEIIVQGAAPTASSSFNPPPGSSTALDEIVVSATKPATPTSQDVGLPSATSALLPEFLNPVIEIPEPPEINFPDDGTTPADVLSAGGDILTAGSGLLPLLPILTGGGGGGGDGTLPGGVIPIGSGGTATEAFKKALPWLLLLSGIIIVTKKSKGKKAHQAARRRLIGKTAHAPVRRESRDEYHQHRQRGRK